MDLLWPCDRYMATSGIDRTLKIWDLRTMKMLHGYRVGMGAGQMSFSQRGILAAGMGSVVEVSGGNCVPYIQGV